MPFDVHAAIAAWVRAEAFRQSADSSTETPAGGTSGAAVASQAVPEAGVAASAPPGVPGPGGSPGRVPVRRGAGGGRRGLRAVLAAVLRGR